MPDGCDAGATLVVVTGVIEPTAPLPDVRIDAGSFSLRPFGPDDLEMIEDAASDPSITSITTVPRTWSPEAGHDFIARQHERSQSGAGWSLAIVDAASDRALGQIGLWLADAAKGRATIGYWVAPSRRRGGAAATALAAISDWAFDHLDLDRLTVYISPTNEASIATARRAGYEREALLLSWERIDGTPRDMLSFGRVRAGRHPP